VEVVVLEVVSDILGR
jgi:hypothetical protein